jgi:hypothetical protein
MGSSRLLLSVLCPVECVRSAQHGQINMISAIL